MKSLKRYFSILFLLFTLNQCRPEGARPMPVLTGKTEIPATIKTDHEYLLNEIGKLTLMKDSAGRVAVKLKELVQHHFEEEESFVLPPLGYLPLIAEGKIPDESEEIIIMTEKLKEQLNHMIAEHQLIRAYLGEMLQEAADDYHLEIISLEKELQKHSAAEEQVFFPAAILVGEFLKLNFSTE